MDARNGTPGCALATHETTTPASFYLMLAIPGQRRHHVHLVAERCPLMHDVRHHFARWCNVGRKVRAQDDEPSWRCRTHTTAIIDCPLHVGRQWQDRGQSPAHGTALRAHDHEPANASGAQLHR